MNKTYTDKILELNLDELIFRYNGPYKSVTKWLRPSFYRDKKEIALSNIQGQVPENVLTDLVSARTLTLLIKEIITYADSLKALTGHFFKSYATDFQAIESAIAKTHQISSLSWLNGVPDKLAQEASSITNQNSRYIALAKEILELLDSSNKEFTDLQSILPTAFMVNSLSIQQAPLTVLESWTKTTVEKLSQLLGITGIALQTCKGDQSPQNYKQLIDGISTAEEIRKKETAFLENQPMLIAHYGSQFLNFDTNWELIIANLHWTRQIQRNLKSGSNP